MAARFQRINPDCNLEISGEIGVALSVAEAGDGWMVGWAGAGKQHRIV